MQTLTLHEDRFSGNCYKLRLVASLVSIKIDNTLEYDTSTGETQTDDFRSKVNANGRIPVLQVGSDKFLPESNASSYYLATGSWLLPTDPWEHAQVLQWMFFEQSFVEPTTGTLRHWYKRVGESAFNQEQQAMVPGKRAAVETALEVMEKHLTMQDFFVGQKPLLCDFILYAYVHLAPDAKFDLEEWPRISAWCRRIEDYPGFVRMNCS